MVANGGRGQRRKRRTSPAPRLPCARGASSLGTRGTGEGAWWRGQRGRRQGHLWRRYDASLSWFRRPEVLRVRACETDPALEERKKQAVLPALRVSAVPCRGARGLLLTLVCPAGGRLAEAPRLPPYVASAAAVHSSSARPRKKRDSTTRSSSSAQPSLDRESSSLSQKKKKLVFSEGVPFGPQHSAG